MRTLRPTRAVVDLDAVAANYHRLAAALPEGTSPMPVVKADAYGHGAGEVARRLEREGAAAFAVAVVEEGVELRRAGVTAPILAMGWIGTGQLPDLVRHSITANVHSVDMITGLAAFARRRGVRLGVHVKLDTGFTRLGFRFEEIAGLIQALGAASPHLSVAGAYQNFPSADLPDRGPTRRHLSAFAEAVKALDEAGLSPAVLHVANSAGTLTRPAWPDGLRPPTFVRPGLVLFAPFWGVPGGDEVRDAMTFSSVVDQVKRVPAGTPVGYGGMFVTSRESTLAVVPAGYADGIPRQLSGRGVVLVHARRCPIAGRVSMDLTAVDVTDLPSRPIHGDEVVFFGWQGGARLGVEEVAEAAGTVAWEILCGVGPRVPRLIVEGGEAPRVLSRFVADGEGRVDGAA